MKWVAKGSYVKKLAYVCMVRWGYGIKIKVGHKMSLLLGKTLWGSGKQDNNGWARKEQKLLCRQTVQR